MSAPVNMHNLLMIIFTDMFTIYTFILKETVKMKTARQNINTDYKDKAASKGEVLSKSERLVPNSAQVVRFEGHNNSNFVEEEAVLNLDDSHIPSLPKYEKHVGRFNDAKDITLLTDDKLLVTDLIGSRLKVVGSKGNAVTLLAPEEISNPWSCAKIDSDKIAVTMLRNKAVVILSINGEVISKIGDDLFEAPSGVASLANGYLVVSDTVTCKVSIVDSKGHLIKTLGNRDRKEECFIKPRYVCASSSGNIIVSDAGSHCVKIFDSNGCFVRTFGSFGKEDGKLKCPYGVCTNMYGDIFVADHYNSRVSMFNRDGIFVSHILTKDHGLSHPQGLTLGPDNKLYVTHGQMKATEILVVQMSSLQSDVEQCNAISYV